MDNEEDPRFAHIASDPRFKPMPKSKKKVKVDSRFQSLFTNKNFSQKTDVDKRGRPAFNRLKKSKSTMEQFYEMSSDSDSDLDASTIEVEDECERNNKYEVSDKNKDTNRSNFESTISKTFLKSKRGNTNQNCVVLQASASSNSKRASVEANGKDSQSSSEVSEESNTDDDHDYNDEADLNEIERESDDEGIELGDQLNHDINEDVDVPIYTEDCALEETEIDHKWNELHTDAVIVQDSTSRLAVCNMDWDFVKAQDLYVLFKSFAPENGNVKSVTIYPSEFGKERMAEEYKLGPKELKDLKTNDDENSVKKSMKKKKDQKREKQERMAESESATEKLREYQLNRLRYYYAVVDCDTVDTADTIYHELDGHEYQLSSVRLDLRFIPEDMTFDDQPKDKFLENQSTDGYQPGSFESSALCSAKVSVTWDETELDRLKKKNLNWSEKEIDSYIESNKLSAFFADSASESEEEQDQPSWLDAALALENSDNESICNKGVDSKEKSKQKKKMTEDKKIDLYRNLLMDKIREDENVKKKDEEDVDMVMEFQPGLKASAVRKLKKKEKKNDEVTVVNEYLEKKREKKKQKRERKLMKKASEDKEDAGAFSDDEIEVDDSLKELMQGEFNENYIKKGKKKKTINYQSDNEINEKEKAELELVLMDNLDSKPSISKPEVVGSKKKKKGKKQKAKEKKLAAAAKEKEEFVLDVNDRRFGALFTSHHFHIDPTAPQYKKTKNMELLMDEQIKRKGPKKRHSDKQIDAEAEKDILVNSIKKKLKKNS